jgi:hypothetical protein
VAGAIVAAVSAGPGHRAAVALAFSFAVAVAVIALAAGLRLPDRLTGPEAGRTSPSPSPQEPEPMAGRSG